MTAQLLRRIAKARFGRHCRAMSNDDAQDLNRRGLAAIRNAEHEIAADYFRQAAEADPSYADAHNHLGAALSLLGRYEEALPAYEQALALAPNKPEAHHNLGYALVQIGRHEEAVERLKQAIKLRHEYPDAWNNLGNALAGMGETNEAVDAYRKALKLEPGFPFALNGLGAALAKLGRPDEALDCYAQALKIEPRYADAFNNAGLALRQLRRVPEAADCFMQAVALAPDSAGAHANLGVAFADLRRPDEAIAAFTRALELDPDNARARSQRLYQLARNSDWDAIEAEKELIPALGIEGGVVPPFSMLALDGDPMRHRVRSERFAAATYTPAARTFARPKARPEKLRIGYFSSDFYNHATMYLAAGLFEAHDRERFSVYAYSYGAPADDDMAARAHNAFDGFMDIRALDDRTAADRAREDGIDIAIDLKGYTEGNRLGIFAERPAPVQISFLGYPGTSGAPFIDYLVADPVVATKQNRNAFSEKLIVLPGCYQANDRSRPDAEGWTREKGGLPESSFVFCCFNNSYKITPTEFDVWMRLLNAVEGGVLWLLVNSDGARERIRMQAERSGIDPQRIVFAGQVSLDEHLARQQAADLFLDTFNYNAHTTASDAMWAGLPLVTLAGEAFAARVAASILHSIGLDELIAKDVQAYEDIAMRLATQKDELEEVRAKLAANRETSRLFDNVTFARNLERGLGQAFDRYLAGKRPADILVA